MLSPPAIALELPGLTAIILEWHSYNRTLDCRVYARDRAHLSHEVLG